MHGDHSPVAKLTMTDDDIVRRFARVTGMGRLYLHESKNPRHADQVCWSATNLEEFQALVAMLWPWLGQRRRHRARELLVRIRDRRCHTCGGELTVEQRRSRTGRPSTTRVCKPCRYRGGRKGRARIGLNHRARKLRPGQAEMF